MDNIIIEYIYLQSRSNHYFLENHSFCGPPLKIEIYISNSKLLSDLFFKKNICK
jgi:hypothetical protein